MHIVYAITVAAVHLGAEPDENPRICAVPADYRASAALIETDTSALAENYEVGIRNLIAQGHMSLTLQLSLCRAW